MRQWDQVSEEFAKVSIAADEAPVGAERVRAHEAALRMAQSHGSFAEEFVARADLTQALYWTPKDPATLVHFAWLRQALEPARELDQDDRDIVLWRLKWAVDLIEDLPQVGLDALVAAIDDVEQVFRGDGYHLRPVHAARARLARSLGDRATVEGELAAWLAEPRDGRSDCQACELREQARLVLEQDPARALELVAPIVAGNLTCGDEPRASLSIDAQLRLDRGDIDGAVARSGGRGTWPRTTRAPRTPSPPASGCWCGWATPTGPSTSSYRGCRGSTSCAPRGSGCGSRHRGVRAGDVVGAGAGAGDRRRRPVEEVAAELSRTATEIAAAFDARYASTVTSDTLAAAHDPAQVASRAHPPRPPGFPSTQPRGWTTTRRCRPRPTWPSAAGVVRDSLASASADLETERARGCATATPCSRSRRRRSGPPCRCWTARPRRTRVPPTCTGTCSTRRSTAAHRAGDPSGRRPGRG